MAVTVPSAFGQGNATQSGAAPQTANAAAQAFEVATIKPNKSGTMSLLGMGPTEYRAIYWPLGVTIGIAYVPEELSSGKLLGLPDWAKNDKYDIVGKLDEPIAEAWKNLTPRQWREKVRPMLQALLVERCKIVVHTVPTEVPGYELVLGKHGSKLKDADPNAIFPSPIVSIPEGGKILPNRGGMDHKVRYFGVSMGTFARRLSGMTGVIVQDGTGLTGTYDFDVPLRDTEHREASEPRPTLPELLELDELGLELKRVKVPAEDLVIDHIERPSEN